MNDLLGRRKSNPKNAPKERVEKDLSGKGLSSDSADTGSKCATKNVKVGVKKALSLNVLHALAASKKAKATATSKLNTGTVGNKDVIGKKTVEDEVVVEASEKVHSGLSGGDKNKEIMKYVSSKQNSSGDVVKDTMTKDRVVVEASDKGPSVVSGTKRPQKDVVYNTDTPPSKNK
ncbi:hypothetical protein AAHA92_21582 [Salvia divinorum]|uniref:Uncharacterized protein n=1 Tax=Salvia divinorum TaxID=28513 RepID=A0ABD1GKX8_SALDI